MNRNRLQFRYPKKKSRGVDRGLFFVFVMRRHFLQILKHPCIRKEIARIQAEVVRAKLQTHAVIVDVYDVRSHCRIREGLNK